MVRESLARKFHPAGFEQPEGSRKNYVKPRAELQYAFDKWVDELPVPLFDGDEEDQYKKARELVQPLGKIPYREANSLLINFEPKTQEDEEEGHPVGVFISACYNQSSEQVIVFDLDAPEINFIGYNLGKPKVLVNNGKAGNNFGTGNSAKFHRKPFSGFVINNGEVGYNFGAYSYGILMNNGKAGTNFGHNTSGLVMMLRNPKHYEPGIWEDCRVLELADCDEVPELKIYVTELRELSKTVEDGESARKFIEKYGVGGKKVEPEINEILKRGGFKL